MRYTKDHKEATRARIVRTASERFRAEGIDNVGVASLMQSAGLTVGGFYAHFASKEDLVGQACASAFEESAARFRAYLAGQPPGTRYRAFVAAYLSEQHRDHPGSGCVMLANAADMARHPDQTRAGFTGLVQRWVGLIGELLRAEGLEGDAQAIAGTLLGNMALARSINDPALSASFLAAGREAAMRLVRPQP